jgi:hypothetical protein
MKRQQCMPRFGKALLAVPAAALMLGASQAAQVGLNFQDNYNGSPYAPLTDTSAFGIALADWINVPSIANSSGTPISTNATFTLPNGQSLSVAWSCKNTWSLTASIPTAGDNQVIYGYLDDTDYGYSVTLSGFRSFASDYTVTTIASTDGGTGFENVNVFSSTQTNTLQYLNNFVPDFTSNNSPLAGTSTVSTAFVTLNANDSITIRGLTKTNSEIRSTLAGILISYTPATNNPPLVEANPQPPVGNLYPGGSFVLGSRASGAPTLHYQWRHDGTDIPGANYANYTNASTAVGDTGDYDVVVTNNFGAVTSLVAHVTIQDVVAPVITQTPRSQNVYPGYPVSFSVAATGGQLAYQWKSNSVAIADATNTTYSIPSASAGDAATYTVDVSNPVGPTASASATLTVKVPAPGSYEAVMAQTKPLVWMRYSETGAVGQDTAANTGSLGSAGNGLFIGSVTHPVAGALVGSSDQATHFSGGKLTVPYNAAVNPSGAFTVDCWFKPTDLNGTGLIVQSMINGENPGNPNDRSGWAIRQNAAGVRLLVGTDTGVPFYYYYTTANILTAGQWHHLAVVYDGTTPSLYVNGVLQTPTVTRQDGVAITQDEINAIRVLPNTAAPLILGDRGYGGWAFSGDIDELAVYASGLSPSQVLAHYQNGTNATPTPAYNTLVTGDGAVEYLRLNDASGLTVAANSGTLGSAWAGAYNDGGTVLGSPQIAIGLVGPRPPAAPGLEAGNIAVGMTNGYVSVPQVADLDVNTITVTGWVYREDPSSGSDLSFLAWLGDGGFHMVNDGELRYHWKGVKWEFSSGLYVPAEQWTFVALVVEPTKATFYMSDGGVLRSAVNTSSHAALAVSTPVEFGAQPGRSDRTYIGRLDESAVYNRALSQSEINTLFMVGTGAPLELGLVPGGIIEDTKPSGALHHGVNVAGSCIWTNALLDANGTNRLGVEQFSTATPSQIVIPADPDFNSTVGTFTFWMRANAPIPGPGTEAAMLIDRRTSNGTIIGLNDSGALQVQCSGGANSFSVGYLPDNNWHHVAVSYDQSASGAITVYIDGILQLSNPNSSAWSWPASQEIELGRSHDGYWKRFDGQMDDFRIYNRVLTDSEVASVFASDAIVDANALKLRYNFDNTGIGQTVTWPFGTLQSSPTLGPSAVWTPVTGATAPAFPFLPTNVPSLFFRATP